MRKKRAQKELDKRTTRAKEILNSPEESEKLLHQADQKLAKSKNRSVLATIPGMLEMLKSYLNRDYREVPVATILGILAAVIYFVSPVDLLPDFIPFIGLVDDAGVIAFCISLFQYDLAAFEKWKQEKETAAFIDAEYTEKDDPAAIGTAEPQKEEKETTGTV